MLGYYNYTVILTYLGMLTAFFGITLSLQGNLAGALICLMVAGFCDMFDGKVASTMADRTVSQKRFGIQIDSLSDLICFGVLPAIIVYQSDMDHAIVPYIAAAYLLCALIRLAYFNVDEEERQSQTEESRTLYLGLPVTTVALLLPAAFCADHYLHWSTVILFPALLVVMGLAFLTPFPLKKPGNLGKAGMVVLGLAEFLLVLVGVFG